MSVAKLNLRASLSSEADVPHRPRADRSEIRVAAAVRALLALTPDEWRQVKERIAPTADAS